MANIQDLLKTYRTEEEPMMSEMSSIQQNRLTDIPPSQSELQEPLIPNETPQEQVFTKPKLTDILPAKSETPMLAEAETLQPSSEVPTVPMSRSEALLAEYQKMLGKDQESLAEARKSDRMLKVGGAIGDALATYLNARSQMSVKAPGVQVQQGAGLGKIADMFATAPEIASDVAARRENLMKQYAELARGERTQARLSSEEKRASDRMTQQERMAKAENEAMLQAAAIRASERGGKGLTPYQEKQIERQEKKEARLSDKQTTELEGINNVLRSIDEVEAAKSGVNTGRYASAFQSGKEILPFSEADQDFVKLRQLSGTQLFDYVKAQSGVSYSVKELEQLKSNMPNVEDDDKTFLTKLQTVRDIVQRKQKEKLSAFEKQGKDVEEFKQQQPSNLVKIKGPSGQEATMTEEKAQKYLSKPGYTRIE